MERRRGRKVVNDNRRIWIEGIEWEWDEEKGRWREIKDPRGGEEKGRGKRRERKGGEERKAKEEEEEKETRREKGEGGNRSKGMKRRR
ncbi:hypothetical protein RF55_16046 [Lasius niger]|uniref:Uncharacterized protein n=1 Tax=Lasius niger TaxID=67767 RepID=A0A0J7K4M7_LASNI|nr:hypothetical protein RF55_16046 [Lasius niger]